MTPEDFRLLGDIFEVGKFGPQGKLLEGKGDQPWNMILLNRTMHKWWSEALWALKFLGKEEVDDGETEKITLQFHWTRQLENRDPLGKVNWAEEKSKDSNILTKITAGRQLDVDNYGLEFDRPLCTGDLFKIKIPKEDAEKFVLVISLQWALIHVAFLSGSAGHPEILPDFKDDEFGDAFGVDTEEEVEDWLGSLP